MSALNFNEFNRLCPIIDPDMQCNKLCQEFAVCIEHIGHEFQYPQYYNGLMGLLLLFNNDATFNLKGQVSIQQFFEETKELVVTGYEDYDNFGTQSLDTLISSLREMSNIFKAIHGDHPFQRFKVLTEINTDECFEDIDGIKTQIEPIDCSIHKRLKKPFEGKIIDYCQQMPLVDKFACDKRTIDLFNRFEDIFGSVTSGYIVTTVIGKILESRDFLV